MPKKAKVFLAEDDQALIKIEKIWIEDPDYGHKVVLVVNSLEEALGKIDLAKKNGVDVAVIDGNLGTGPGDGPEVAQALKRAISEIEIISFSGEPVDWGDFNPRKPSDISNLGGIITEALSK